MCSSNDAGVLNHLTVTVINVLSVQAFGISEEEISQYIGNGIICWGDLVRSILEDVELRIQQTRNSETKSLVTVLLEGRFTGLDACCQIYFWLLMKMPSVLQNIAGWEIARASSL